MVSAQQPPQPRRGEARTPGSGAPGAPRGARERARPSANSTAALEEDFTEALTIVEENYVDGQKIDYGTAFKSSIIGMLRT
ncbi:MAG: hypothetical protein LC800_21105, partial [Acidobacteria bacterium]|nr:hypothetical protein [Acidobacteriota bacterium]